MHGVGSCIIRYLISCTMKSMGFLLCLSNFTEHCNYWLLTRLYFRYCTSATVQVLAFIKAVLYILYTASIGFLSTLLLDILHTASIDFNQDRTVHTVHCKYWLLSRLYCIYCTLQVLAFITTVLYIIYPARICRLLSMLCRTYCTFQVLAFIRRRRSEKLLKVEYFPCEVC